MWLSFLCTGCVYPPSKYSWHSFLLEANSTSGAIVRPKGNRSRNLPACSAVSQQTALSGAPQWSEKVKIKSSHHSSCSHHEFSSKSTKNPKYERYWWTDRLATPLVCVTLSRDTNIGLNPFRVPIVSWFQGNVLLLRQQTRFRPPPVKAFSLGRVAYETLRE